MINNEAPESAFEDATRALLAAHGESLIRLAAASIRNGLATGKALAVDAADYPETIAAEGACFVTLKHGPKLRGCIGSPQARRTLVEDVAGNAFAAAFEDPRFANLQEDELDGLNLSISVLSPQVAIDVSSEAELLARLRPGIDGLIIEDQGRRALFLPSVWEQLPSPEQFLAHLKAKAGLPQNPLSADLKAWRFIAEEVADECIGGPEALWQTGET